MTIHNDRNDFWRFPEDRLLISHLIKTPDAKLQYLPKKGKWKSNGKKISLEGPTWGKFHEIVVRIFREIRFAFQGQYKKNFYLTKDAIYRAYVEGGRKGIEVEWHIDKRRKSLPFLDKKARVAKARMKRVLESTENYIQEVNDRDAPKVALLNERIAKESIVIKAFQSFLKSEQYEEDDILLRDPRYRKISLYGLKKSEVEKLLRQLVKQRESLKKEIEGMKKRKQLLISQLEKMNEAYTGQSHQIRAAIVAIKDSPLKPARPKAARRLNF